MQYETRAYKRAGTLESYIWYIAENFPRWFKEVKEASYLGQDLERVNKRLKELDREQGKLLEWALKGFPAEIVIKTNERINRDRTELKQQGIELETRIDQAKHAEVDIAGVKRFCELARQNLRNFTFNDKRLALEALQVKVWIEGNAVNIEGAIPIAEEDATGITPRCSG